MARRKQAALDVPASAGVALALIEGYVAAERNALDVRLRTESAIDRLKGDRDAVLVGIEAEQKTRFARLKAWWEAGGKSAAGARRSAELGGATIGVRTSPPALKLPKGRTAKQLVGDLLSWLGGDFIRTSHELDKPAIVAQLRRELGPDATAEELHDRRVLAGELGFTTAQKDEFFIDAGLSEPGPARDAETAC